VDVRGSTKEILPWIRGWGAAVEILEPQAFREEMMDEVRKMSRLYGIE
jgi:CRISPR-associated endonuclease/helicase Cas3